MYILHIELLVRQLLEIKLVMLELIEVNELDREGIVPEIGELNKLVLKVLDIELLEPVILVIK